MHLNFSKGQLFFHVALVFVFVGGVPKQTPNDFPDRRHLKTGKMYFAIAASPGGQVFSRAFNKTLTNITQAYLTSRLDFSPYNVTLESLVVELPENGSFSSGLLEKLCMQFEDKHVVAVLVAGESPAGFAVTMAAKQVGVPVLWARGQSVFLTGFRSLVSHSHMVLIGL